jgi:hypothetical protein
MDLKDNEFRPPTLLELDLRIQGLLHGTAALSR